MAAPPRGGIAARLRWNRPAYRTTRPLIEGLQDSVIWTLPLLTCVIALEGQVQPLLHFIDQLGEVGPRDIC